jgi:hypothetical protein
MKSSPDRELRFLGFKRFMTGSILGHGSNPAHGEAERKGRTYQKRRGFRPTIVRPRGHDGHTLPTHRSGTDPLYPVPPIKREKFAPKIFSFSS